MKKSIHLIIAAACIILFSSCASVFETRNYSHLHYVKQKETKHEEIAMKNPTSDNEMSPLPLSSKNKITIPEQEPQIVMRPIEKHQSNRSSLKSEELTQTRRNISTETKPLNLPRIPIFKEQQKKIEAATDQLFSGLDHDLRLALIFGIIGFIVLLLAALLYTPGFGEVVYTIGIILIIIGLVFLIKYLVENG